MDKNVRADDQALAEIRVLATRTTPTLVVGDTVIAGFDPAAYAKALGV